jgi:hypothetical protein
VKASGKSTFAPREADRVEALCDGLSEAEENQVWDEYVARGYDAARLVAASYEASFKARYKVIGDVIDQALERLRSAAVAAAQSGGDASIAKAIDALAAQLAPVPGRPTLTDSGTQSVLPAATKASTHGPSNVFRDAHTSLGIANMDPIEQAIKYGQWDGR